MIQNKKVLFEKKYNDNTILCNMSAKYSSINNRIFFGLILVYRFCQYFKHLVLFVHAGTAINNAASVPVVHI